MGGGGGGVVAMSAGDKASPTAYPTTVFSGLFIGLLQARPMFSELRIVESNGVVKVSVTVLVVVIRVHIDHLDANEGSKFAGNYRQIDR